MAYELLQDYPKPVILRYPGSPKRNPYIKYLIGALGICCLLVTCYIATHVSTIPMKSLFESKVQQQDHPVRKDFIQILITTEHSRFSGVIALVNSILTNTQSPLHFYFVTSLEDSSLLHSHIEKSLSKRISYEIKVFDPTKFGYNISSLHFEEDEDWLELSKLHVSELFPQASTTLVVLSDDMIVQGDIANLAHSHLLPGHYAALTTDCDIVSKLYKKNKNRYYHYLNLSSPTLKQMKINGQRCAFDMSVMVLNITLWKKENIGKQLRYWKEYDKKEKIFLINSTVSPFLIVFYKKVSALETSWHVRHLGVTTGTRYSREYLQKANLLHWDGHFKPWKHKLPYLDMWTRYTLPTVK